MTFYLLRFMAISRSMANTPENDGTDRFKHQCNVVANRPTPSIMQVHPHPFFEANIAAF